MNSETNAAPEQIDPEMPNPYAILKALLWLEDNHYLKLDTVRRSTTWRSLDMLREGVAPPEVEVNTLIPS